MDLFFCFFFVRERKRKEGEQGRARGIIPPLESGFWGTRAQESVNLASLRGGAGWPGGPRRAD